MRRFRVLRIPAAIALAAAWILLAGSTAWAADEKPALTKDDCIKCHAAPPADIAAAGGKHKSDVSCLDCHAGHRPASKNNIPLCSNCHEGKEHYKLKDCQSCHKNPHKPLNIVIAGKVTAPCLTCHAPQIKQLKESPSKHTALYCTSCHDVHRKAPDCTKCHKPHSAQMVQADCKKCHKAHMPKAVTYASTVPNQDCGACHKAAFALLSASTSKHKGVTCVQCHKDKHRTVPACAECHTKQHPTTILQKFPKCGACHNIAHDLNHWSEAPAAAAAKPKPAAKEVPKKKRK